jgi:hypothetical protein
MAEPNRGYERVISELVTGGRGKIKIHRAKELIEELKTILPLKISPYSPSGKFNSNRILLYIAGMLLIGVLFVPILDFYIGYIQKYVESKGLFRGTDYVFAVGTTFYLIGTILAAHIFSSYIGSKFLGHFSQCRNTKIVVAATTLPAIVVIVYLQTIAAFSFSNTSQFNNMSNSNDGYLMFIMLQSLLFGLSGLFTALITGLLYAEENMYHEQTGTFFDTVESPKYNIARVNDFWNAFQENDRQKLLRIVKEAEIDPRKKDFYNDGYNYFQIVLKKLPYHCEYLYGYIQGCIVIKVNVEGNNTVSDSWDFLFDKADKSLIDSLSWTIKKYL